MLKGLTVGGKKTGRRCKDVSRNSNADPAFIVVEKMWIRWRRVDDKLKIVGESCRKMGKWKILWSTYCTVQLIFLLVAESFAFHANPTDSLAGGSPKGVTPNMESLLPRMAFGFAAYF